MHLKDNMNWVNPPSCAIGNTGNFNRTNKEFINNQKLKVMKNNMKTWKTKSGKNVTLTGKYEEEGLMVEVEFKNGRKALRHIDDLYNINEDGKYTLGECVDDEGGGTIFLDKIFSD